MLEAMFELITLQGLLIALAVTFFAGMVKGMVGFAMPMIMISGLSTFIPPELALAALILPTLVSNGMQALRHGIPAAISSILKFRLFLVVGCVMLVISAQLVRVMPQHLLFIGIGAPIVLFVVSQLAGWRPRTRGRSKPVEIMVGAFAGFIGGLSGVWGPPTVAYLTAIDTPKDEHLRVQGVIYGLGAVALLFAHMQSGVMRAQTVPLSLVMIVPAMLGMMLGFKLHDRIDQVTFRRATLVVLLVAGLNLLRKGILE